MGDGGEGGGGGEHRCLPGMHSAGQGTRKLQARVEELSVHWGKLTSTSEDMQLA